MTEQPEDALAVLAMAEDLRGQVEEKISELLEAQMAMRELVSQMHGATRDARTARREVLEATAKLDGSIDGYVAERLTAIIRESDEAMHKRTEEMGRALRDTVSVILGASSQTELLSILSVGMMDTLMPVMIGAIEKALPDIVRKQLGLRAKVKAESLSLTEDTSGINRAATDVSVTISPAPSKAHVLRKGKRGG